jgi:hypothetical protein
VLPTELHSPCHSPGSALTDSRQDQAPFKPVRLGSSASGVDRIVMLLCGTTNLREISLFPMNQQAVDLLMGAPSEVATKQLRELHIRLNLPDKG